MVVLVSLLIATIVVAYLGWTLGSGTEAPTSGYVAIALGVIFSLAVGFGLMAKILLVRHGHVEGMCCSDQLNPPRKAVVQRLSKLLRAAKIDTVACVYVRRAIDN